MSSHGWRESSVDWAGSQVAPSDEESCSSQVAPADATEHAARAPTPSAASSTDAGLAAEQPGCSSAPSTGAANDADASHGFVPFLVLGADSYAPDASAEDKHVAALEAVIAAAEGTLSLYSAGEAQVDEAAAEYMKAMWNIIHQNKSGCERDDTRKFCVWLQRCNGMRARFATEQSPAWAGGLCLDHRQKTICFNHLIDNMLQNELSADQRADRRYWILRDRDGAVWLSSFQRSWAKMMLRKHLGNWKVCMHVFQHGLPRLFATRRSGRLLQSNVPNRLADLESALAEALKWLAGLVLALQDHDTSSAPQLTEQRALAERPERRTAQQQALIDALRQQPANKRQRRLPSPVRTEHSMGQTFQ